MEPESCLKDNYSNILYNYNYTQVIIGETSVELILQGNMDHSPRQRNGTKWPVRAAADRRDSGARPLPPGYRYFTNIS